MSTQTVDTHGAQSTDPHADPSYRLAHHFEEPEQQFQSGKLGIWLFLVTEILMFSGLFLAYALYRTYETDAFVYAHHYLDTTMGFINTLVLLFSSLTAAWAVRAAQLGQRQILVATLALTVVCAGGFMVIKAFEYSHKIHDGLLPMRPDPTDPEATIWWDPIKDKDGKPLWLSIKTGEAQTEPGQFTPAEREPNPQASPPPKGLRSFFGIYYVMTGLHATHVIAGMLILTVLTFRARAGRYGPNFFGPVDYAALFWHIVDMVWIFLFPLLYLIR